MRRSPSYFISDLVNISFNGLSSVFDQRPDVVTGVKRKQRVRILELTGSVVPLEGSLDRCLQAVFPQQPTQISEGADKSNPCP